MELIPPMNSFQAFCGGEDNPVRNLKSMYGVSLLGQALTSHFSPLELSYVEVSKIKHGARQIPDVWLFCPSCLHSVTFLGYAGTLKDLCVSALVLACPSALICRVLVSKGTTL